MTWRVRSTEDELPILRGLIDEIVAIIEMGCGGDGDFYEEVYAEGLLEKIEKTIWEANNEPKWSIEGQCEEPIWWPRHITVGDKIHLIEERLGNDKEVLETRTKHIY
jgi:hypothetical protein